MVATPRDDRQQRARVPWRGRDRPPNALADRARRGADPARARADGGRQRAGVQAPGTALRRRARVLGDGELRGHRAPQRAHARLPASRRGRAPARDPALRLGPALDGGRGAHGRGRRSGPRRPQLRLPREEGDAHGRGSAPARGRRPRVPDRRGGRRGRRPPGDGQAPPWRPERLARLSRARPQARRSRRARRSRSTPAPRSRCTPAWPTTRSRPSSSPSSTSPSSRPGT